MRARMPERKKCLLAFARKHAIQVTITAQGTTATDEEKFTRNVPSCTRTTMIGVAWLYGIFITTVLSKVRIMLIVNYLMQKT